MRYALLCLACAGAILAAGGARADEAWERGASTGEELNGTLDLTGLTGGAGDRMGARATGTRGRYYAIIRGGGGVRISVRFKGAGIAAHSASVQATARNMRMSVRK